jgi:hypothetical protein
MRNSWSIIVAGAGIAFGIGFVWMFVLQFCAAVFTWLAILIYFILLSLIGVFSYLKSQDYDE